MNRPILIITRKEYDLPSITNLTCDIILFTNPNVMKLIPNYKTIWVILNPDELKNFILEIKRNNLTHKSFYYHIPEEAPTSFHHSLLSLGYKDQIPNH